MTNRLPCHRLSLLKGNSRCRSWPEQDDFVSVSATDSTEKCLKFVFRFVNISKMARVTLDCVAYSVLNVTETRDRALSFS